MATLIPAFGECDPCMKPEERRLAERLEQNCRGSYLLWWDIPLGPEKTRPRSVVLHARWGSLILEAKDLRWDAIVTRERIETVSGVHRKVAMSLLQRVRRYVLRMGILRDA